VLAFIIGTLALAITGYKKRPVLTTLILGFIGVATGDLLANRLHLPDIIPQVFGISILWSTIGAVVFILGYSLLRGRW
jgi:uncharacterized membrane protein YeaQ/YmgE (transglycosylase-associated protein family)